MESIRLSVNGKAWSGEVEPRLLLADFLRHRVGFKGTHIGCEHGVCGACTVRMNGETVRSCLTFAVQADGGTLETVESLAGDGPLTALQAAFHRHHALQCGFCTPGFLMVLTEFLQRVPEPSDAQIVQALSGNLCRCTGYVNMIAAVREAAAEIRKGTK
jgi:aerobic-type carbon monoxide dehydrogenase small subunit (CoxS/CutS family)